MSWRPGVRNWPWSARPLGCDASSTSRCSIGTGRTVTEPHRRPTARHSRVTSSPQPRPRLAPREPAERSADARMARDTLSALGDLDPVEQTVLRLIYWSGYSQAQV